MKETQILLVEDNRADVRLTLEALKEFGISGTVDVAYDGESAIEYVKNKLPNFILLDLNLPKKTGFEVLEFLKSNYRTKQIPVVILTTSDHKKDVATAYKKGANGYLTKPVGLDDFLDCIAATGNFWLLLVKLPEDL